MYDEEQIVFHNIAIVHFEGDLPMEKNRIKTNDSDAVLSVIDGIQYFIMGNIRIKVSEHFAENGKPLDYLLEDVIQHAAIAS